MSQGCGVGPKGALDFVQAVSPWIEDDPRLEPTSRDACVRLLQRACGARRAELPARVRSALPRPDDADYEAQLADMADGAMALRRRMPPEAAVPSRCWRPPAPRSRRASGLNRRTQGETRKF